MWSKCQHMRGGTKNKIHMKWHFHTWRENGQAWDAITKKVQTRTRTSPKMKKRVVLYQHYFLALDPSSCILGIPESPKEHRVGLAHPLSLIADPSGPTGHTIPKKVNSVVMPSLWSDSQDSFDMCLSVKTSFLTLPLPTRPHFLSVIPSWHLLPLSLLLLSLLPYPPCALSPSIASSFPSLLSLPRSWLSRTHTVFLLSSPVFSL